MLFSSYFSYCQYLSPPPLKKCILPPSFLRTFPMELEYPENIKNSLNEIYYRFSEKYGYNNFSQSFFCHFYPFFEFCPPPQKKMHSHLPTFQLYFFHCRDNMVKINTFSMEVSKTYCLFHFQTEICFFSIFFSDGQCLALEKMHIACEYF